MVGFLRGMILLILISLGLVNYGVSEATDKIVIKDLAGREVSIPKKVQRIVALNSSLRFIVYLKETDKVVGMEAFEKKEVNNPNRPYLSVFRKKIDILPTVGEGGPGRLPDFEKLISIAPDIIFTTNIDIEQADLIQRRVNIPVVVLDYGGVGVLNISSVYNTLSLLGKILNAEKRANELKDYINNTLQDLKKRTESISDKQKPTVYVGAVNYRGTHGITSTQGSYPPLEWINALNVAKFLKKDGPIFIDKEQLLLWNPDVIFIDNGGLSLVNEDYKKNDSYYKKLKAVKNNRVYSLLQFNSYFTNLELALANSYFIGKILYPDRFYDIDPAKKADEIIKFFIGLPVYEEIKSKTKGFGAITFREDGIEIK